MRTLKNSATRQNRRARLRSEELESRATPATFTVDTKWDSNDDVPGDGFAEDIYGWTSLRAAIEEGNALGGSHTINFAGAVFGSGLHQIDVLVEQLELTADFTINGPTTANVSLVPIYDVELPTFRIMLVDNASTSTIKNLTFSGGYLPEGSGGGILNNGELTLDACTISFCQADFGGGIANHGVLWLLNSSIYENYAKSGGGGISTAANQACHTYLEYSTVTGNSNGGAVMGKGGGISLLANALLSITGGGLSGNESLNGGIGGAIYSSGGILTINGCTLSGNLADANGGGIYFAGGTAVLTDVAVSGNSAGNWGGGFFAEPTSNVTLTECTFSETNIAGSGGPKAAYSGVLDTNVFITLNDCTGIDDDDLVDQD